jgi:hypothetical protein
MEEALVNMTRTHSIHTVLIRRFPSSQTVDDSPGVPAAVSQPSRGWLGAGEVVMTSKAVHFLKTGEVNLPGIEATLLPGAVPLT